MSGSPSQLVVRGEKNIDSCILQSKNHRRDKSGYRWMEFPNAITVSISLYNVTWFSTHILHMPLSLSGQMPRFHPEEIPQSKLEKCSLGVETIRDYNVNSAALSETSLHECFLYLVEVNNQLSVRLTCGLWRGKLIGRYGTEAE